MARDLAPAPVAASQGTSASVRNESAPGTAVLAPFFAGNINHQNVTALPDDVRHAALLANRPHTLIDSQDLNPTDPRAIGTAIAAGAAAATVGLAIVEAFKSNPAEEKAREEAAKKQEAERNELQKQRAEDQRVRDENARLRTEAEHERERRVNEDIEEKNEEFSIQRVKSWMMRNGKVNL